MIKTTRQNSFLVYFRSTYGGIINNSRRANGWSSETVFIIFATYLLMFVIGQTSRIISEDYSGATLPSASAVSFLVYATVLGMGIQLRSCPSVFNLLPISWKKRTVYFYAAALLNTLLIIIGLVAFMSVMFMVIALFVLAVTGEWVFVVGEEEGIAEVLTIGVQGHLFSVCLLILIFGAATAICFIKSAKLRRFAYFAFPVALYIPLLVMINLSNLESGFTARGNIAGNFENLPLSWLWLVISALVAVGVFAFGVYRLIQHERPKNF